MIVKSSLLCLWGGPPAPLFFFSLGMYLYILLYRLENHFNLNFFSKVGEIFLAAGSSYSKLGRQPIQYNNRLRCVCPQMFVSCVNNKQLIKSKQNGTLNVLPRKKAATILSQVNIIFLSPNPVCAFFILWISLEYYGRFYSFELVNQQASVRFIYPCFHIRE